MALTRGTRLGVYEVIASIGEGGMGQVFRARDTKLNRDVALKVLPDSFASDPDRLARFQREAQVLASLNHPHIAAIYGFEEGGGVSALVMELVEGEDLSQRIAHGAIPLDEALPIAKQIAGALEAAHEHGIIHRDLKPANIKVRQDGTVKVLDFGLAKAMDPVSSSAAAAALAHSPTITSPAAMTAAGLILGTAAYMSPEQARGKPVDRRTDIWAFGCCLYEALTGRLAFPGDTVSDTIAHILEREPDWSALPASVPASIRTLLRRCLQKDPGRRVRDVRDVGLELDELVEHRDALVEPASGGIHPTARHQVSARWRWVSASLGILALAALAFAAYVLTRPVSRASAAAQRLVVTLPPDVRLTETSLSNSMGQTGYPVALSPDDRQLAFVGTRGTVTQLYVRRLDQYDVRPLPGTEHATVPFFSPDGSWVGFQSGGKLRKVPLAGAGGIPGVICDLPGAISAAAWGSDDEIVFASRAGLSRVAASGGTPQALTTLLPGEVAHDRPQLLPRDRMLFTVVTSALGQPGRSEIAVLSKTTRERHQVLNDAEGGLSLAGHLVFVRAGSLWSVPFNATTGLVTGTPLPRVNDVFGAGGAIPSYAASANALLYVPGWLDGTLLWVERDGRTSPLFGERGAYQHPMLSPEGTRVAFDAGRQGAKDLWVYDIPRGTRIRLTTSDEDDLAPIWTPDGRALAYTCNSDLCRISANGAGQPESLLRREYLQFPTSWSPDGRILIYGEVHPTTGGDIWMWQPGHAPTPILATSFNESGAVFSPDGRFLAYVSDESGRVETYVRPYPKGAEKWLISTNRGAEPVWSRDGQELFYRQNDTMMVVSVDLQPTFRAGVPRRLFDGRFDRSDGHQHYSAGGGRFLKVQRDQDVGSDRLHVILNFAEELNASASPGR